MNEIIRIFPLDFATFSRCPNDATTQGIERPSSLSNTFSYCNIHSIDKYLVFSSACPGSWRKVVAKEKESKKTFIQSIGRWHLHRPMPETQTVQWHMGWTSEEVRWQIRHEVVGRRSKKRGKNRSDSFPVRLFKSFLVHRGWIRFYGWSKKPNHQTNSYLG